MINVLGDHLQLSLSHFVLNRLFHLKARTESYKFQKVALSGPFDSTDFIPFSSIETHIWYSFNSIAEISRKETDTPDGFVSFPVLCLRENLSLKNTSVSF